jgi:hypothetical protein
MGLVYHPAHRRNDVGKKPGKIDARIPIRLKIVTGIYILQSDKAAFSKKSTSPICLLCKKSEDTTTHFLIVCEKFEETRTPILSKIIQQVSSIFAKLKLCGKIDLLQIIINPFAYIVCGW